MSTRADKRDTPQPDEEGILARVRSMFETADPVPDGLVERMRFAVVVAGLEAELAQLTDELPEPAARERTGHAVLARGEHEESRTITFDSSSLTIMIRIESNADGTARVDGWLAPPRHCQVEMTLTGGVVRADADEQGRFAFPSVPRGTVRLVVRPPETGSGDGQPRSPGLKAVITPALVLLAGA